MTTLTVTAKGQVTLRKDVLEHMGIRPGDKLVLNKLPGGGIAVKAARRTGKISDLFGMLKRKGQPKLTIAQINEAIAKGWAGEE